MTDWYTKTGSPSTGSQGASATMRNEFAAIESDISDKLPTLTGNGSEVVVVNSGGTALETTPQLSVAQGGTGAASLTDGGILLGSGTGAITAMSVLADGQIVIGDGTTDPTTLSAFTSSTGQLKHEYGGLEANISGVVDGDFIVGTGTGTVGLESGATVRTTMGLGSIATQNSNAVSITGGSATGLTDLSTTNFSIGGAAVTATATELNYTDVTTPGTAEASKAVVLDANKAIQGLGNNISIGATRRSSLSMYAIDFGDSALIRNHSSNYNLSIISNAYTDAAGVFYYSVNGYAPRLNLNTSNGAAIISVAATGVAGGTISYTEVLSVNADTTVTINGSTAWHAGNYPYSAESGYVSIGGGTYRRSTMATPTVLVLNTLTSIAAPTNATGLILRLYVITEALNSVALRTGTINVYSDAGTTISGIMTVETYEQVATAVATPLGSSTMEVFAPVVSGNAYVKWTAGGNATYAIVGYTR